jgi:hypothetical protein
MREAFGPQNILEDELTDEETESLAPQVGGVVRGGGREEGDQVDGGERPAKRKSSANTWVYSVHFLRIK